MKRPSRKKAVAVTKPASTSHEDALFARVVEIIEAARGHVSRSVNTAIVQAYWLIGREIVEVEQYGEKRAGYGDEVIERLAQRLAASVGQGFGARTLRRIRQFYVTYPEGSALLPELGGPAKRTAALSKSKPEKIRTAPLTKSAVVLAPFPPHLGWTHYLVLLRVTNPTARAFYEIEAVREIWSSREPENNEQILAARYQMYLPTEEELRAELAREREAVERALRLAASVNGDDKCSESSR
jgi:hypothetical protein